MNPVSLKFSLIEKNLYDIKGIIKSNQNILRYMKYIDSQDPLSNEVEIDYIDENNNEQTKIIEQPDIQSNDKIMKNIFLRPFDNTDISTSNQSKIFINPYRLKLTDQTVNTDLFAINIMIPNIDWEISSSGQIRPLRIANEISQSIDNQNIMGLGRVFIVKAGVSKINDNYSSLDLILKINKSAKKGKKDYE